QRGAMDAADRIDGGCGQSPFADRDQTFFLSIDRRDDHVTMLGIRQRRYARQGHVVTVEKRTGDRFAFLFEQRFEFIACFLLLPVAPPYATANDFDIRELANHVFETRIAIPSTAVRTQSADVYDFASAANAPHQLACAAFGHEHMV